MNFAAPKTAGRFAAASLTAVALLGATGCSFVNEQATTIVYAPSDGIVQEVGATKLSNLLLVSESPSSPGRYLGSVFNTSDESLEVVFTIEGAATRLTVPAGGRLELGEPENEHIIPDTGSFPGGMAEASIDAGDASMIEQIPVVDGTLEAYRPYVPGGWDPSTVEHLYSTPAAPEGGEH